MSRSSANSLAVKTKVPPAIGYLDRADVRSEPLTAKLEVPEGCRLLTPYVAEDMGTWNGCPHSIYKAIVQPEAAALILANMNNFDGQRKPSPKRVQDLSDRMKAKLYRYASICVAVTAGTHVLMDAQQSLQACFLSGLDMKAVVEQVHISDPDKLAVLFAQHDNGNGRTPATIGFAYASNAGIQICRKDVAPIMGGLALSKWQTWATPKVSSEERAAFMVSQVKYVKLIMTLTQNRGVSTTDQKIRKPLRRPQVVRAMYETLRETQKEAKAFWLRLRDGADLQRDTAAYGLFYWLSNLSLGCNDPASSKKTKVTAPQILGQCYEGWLAHRDERPMRPLSQEKAEKMAKEGRKLL